MAGAVRRAPSGDRTAARRLRAPDPGPDPGRRRPGRLRRRRSRADGGVAAHRTERARHVVPRRRPDRAGHARPDVCRTRLAIRRPTRDHRPMTDPLALDPILPPAERVPVPSPDGLDHDAWFDAFEAHVTGGGSVEATDPMP